jgi:predicted permease
MIFGLLPAIAATRTRTVLLSSAGRGVAGERHRLQGAIVVGQLALGVVLAGTAGLLVRSYGALAAVDAGLDSSHVLTFHVGAAWDEDRDRVADLQRRLIGAFEQLPGVRAAGFANFLPATGATLRSQVRVHGLTAPTDTTGFTVGTRTVYGGYLKTLGVPLVAGEWCPKPRGGVWDKGMRAAMVNRKFVATFAGGANVVGRELTLVGAGGFTPFQIDGVVGDLIEDGPASPPAPYVYLCLPPGAWPDPEYVLRTEGDPRAAITAVRAVVKATDSSRPLFGVQPLSVVMDAALDQPRLNAQVITTFAVAALALAALGLYGLLTLLVSQRRKELGVRIALGAAPRDLIRLVAAGAGRLVIAGTGAGLLLTLAAGQLVRSLLFGVAPYDAAAVGVAVLSLAAVAFAAAVVPAVQAARVSAMEAMKT